MKESDQDRKKNTTFKHQSGRIELCIRKNFFQIKNIKIVNINIKIIKLDFIYLCNLTLRMFLKHLIHLIV